METLSIFFILSEEFAIRLWKHIMKIQQRHRANGTETTDVAHPPSRSFGVSLFLTIMVLGGGCLGLTLMVQVLRVHSLPIPSSDEGNSSALTMNLAQPNRGQYGTSLIRAERQSASSRAAGRNHHLEKLLASALRAQSEEDFIARDEALNRTLKGISPEMAAALLERMKMKDLSGDVARRLFDHWATAIPSEAAAWAREQTDSKLRQSLMNVAAIRWATADLAEAVSWAQSLSEANDRAVVLAAVGSEAVRSSPLVALRLAVEMPTGSTAREDLIRRAVGEWAASDPVEAAQWSAQIEDVGLRQHVTELVAVATAEQDPVAAAQIALHQMTPGGEQDRVIVAIVQRWVQTDPDAAAEWLMKFPPCALGHDAMNNLVNLWADRDLTAAGNWLLTLPEGNFRNVGILTYSRTLEQTDAVMAQRWASSVSSAAETEP